MTNDHHQGPKSRGAEGPSALGSFAFWGEQDPSAEAPADVDANTPATTDDSAVTDACPDADAESNTHL